MIFQPALSHDRDPIISLHVEISRQAYAAILPHDYLQDIMPFEKLNLWTRRFETLDDPNTQITVAEQEAEMVGFICFQFNHEPEVGSYLHNLYVRRDLRGSGLARALISKALERFDSDKLGHAVHMVSFAENVPARHFYDRLGGAVVERSMREHPGNPPIEIVRYQWQSALLLAETVRL